MGTQASLGRGKARGPTLLPDETGRRENHQGRRPQGRHRCSRQERTGGRGIAAGLSGPHEPHHRAVCAHTHTHTHPGNRKPQRIQQGRQESDLLSRKRSNMKDVGWGLGTETFSFPTTRTGKFSFCISKPVSWTQTREALLRPPRSHHCCYQQQ